jgi:thiol-disulfide isomerase/thioredoxin
MTEKASNPSPANKPQALTPDKIKALIRNMGWQGKIGIGIVAVLLASVGIFQKRAPLDDTTENPETEFQEVEGSGLEFRKKLSDFKLELPDGKTRDFSDFKGQVVIVSFWASWSEPSLREIQQLAQLKKKFADQGLTVLPIDTDKDSEAKTTATEFWKKRGFDFPTFVDSNEVVSQVFKVDQIPAHFVIDRLGRMVFSSVGENDWSNPLVLQPVLDLLAEPKS